ncbi:MAG: protease pro-enzyme activation domain-containing protein, partial [Silvibacterium sp.]
MNPARLITPFFRTCLAVALFATCAVAQSSGPSSRADNAIDETSSARTTPLDRVRGPVTEERTPLKGQTRPMARGAVDLGEVPASMSTGRMVLWLRRSAEQQAQLSQFLSHAQKPGSASYRHWMTPASYGATYGISDHDLTAVQQWLEANGLKVEQVSSARNAILFSGTAGSLASAFHTSIHSYIVDQQRHFANAADPEIPTALVPVISAVSPMNDFHAKPMHVLSTPARYDAASGRLRPALSVTNSIGGYDLFVTPADASIIYDTPNQSFNPAATQTLDGTGVTIGILGYSALVMADVQNFRTAFLPAGAASNLPQQILDGGLNPGVLDGNDAVESLLDVEIAGGLAPGAGINYYYAASSDLSDGLILAGLRALEDNKVNILSVSYGECEAYLGLGGNLAWSELWQQAAAQGITVSVATGDSGSASCDADTQVTPVQATLGLSISGLASTPYNIAVGGTDFYSLATNFSTYVDTSTSGNYPYYATALSYIPENPWNDSSTVVGNSFLQNSPAYVGIGDTDIIGGGGGLSSAATCPGYIDSEGACSQSLSGYPQPPFQTGFESINPVRAMPDVALLSGNGFYGAAWVFCSDSTTDAAGGVSTDCRVDSSGHLIDAENVGAIGGTSAAAPAFAGMLAMISQSQGGARLGQADAVLYNLAQDYNPDPNNPGKYQRSFHDIAIGNNSVYCATGSPDCASNNFLEGYNATPFYDMASGLGSIDLSQLISLWTATNFVSTSNTLAAGTSTDSLSGSAISVVHGTPLYFATTVTPNDATGQFSLLNTNSTTSASFSDFGTLDNTATGNLTTNDLPGGTYTVYAYYAGDTSHIGSQSSNSISVTISPEPSTTTLSFSAYDPATDIINEGISTVPYGFGSFISAQPFGNSSTVDYTGTLFADGVATGSVTFTSNGTTQSAAINSLGVAQISASSLVPGSYTYQASYPGDVSFAPSTSTTQTLTITKGPTSFSLQSNGTALTPVGQVNLTAILQTDSIALYPTGTVSASANGHTYLPLSSAQGQSNGSDAIAFAFTIQASDLVTGSNTVSVSYGGDTNYQAANASISVTLVGASGSYSLTGPSQPLVIEASQQSSTTISIVPSNGFTGQVNMACTVSAAPTGHTPTCEAAATTVYGSFNATSVVTVASYADTPAGTYTITVTGTSAQQSQSVQIPLQVTAGPGFALAAANTSLSIPAAGQAATDIISISPTQNFSGTVTLSCNIAPTPTSGKVPICTLPGSIVLGSSTPATATLQVATDSTTPAGTYTVTVTAISGVVQQSLAVSFTLPQLRASPTFGLSAANSTVSVAASGESVTDTLTISPAGGFTGTVQLSCAVSGGTSSTAPPTCVVPATASVTGNSVVNATLTVNTTGSTAALAPMERHLLGERIGGIALGCLLVFMIPRRRIWTALGVFVMIAGVAGITGCGGGGRTTVTTPTGGSTGTPTGGYTVTVTAASGSISATTQIQVT